MYAVEGLIQIRPGVAKTTRRKSGDRRYPPIEPALAHWIEPHRRESGAVVLVNDPPPYWFVMIRGIDPAADAVPRNRSEQSAKVAVRVAERRRSEVARAGRAPNTEGLFQPKSRKQTSGLVFKLRPCRTASSPRRAADNRER